MTVKLHLQLKYSIYTEIHCPHPRLILTTNLEFSKWGSIFTDDQMAAAMIDRLVHHGHLFVFSGKSYRMEHALMKQTAPQQASQ